MSSPFEGGHLSAQALRQVAGGADQPSSDAELAHVADCALCAQRLAALIESDALLQAEPPASLASGARRKLRALPNERDRRREFRGFCLRVGVAVCASLVLVFSGVFARLPDPGLALAPMSGGLAFAERLVRGMRNFSDKLIGLEVQEDDNKAQ